MKKKIAWGVLAAGFVALCAQVMPVQACTCGGEKPPAPKPEPTETEPSS